MSSIIFNAGMVRALLAGNKTQTRRPVSVCWNNQKRCPPYEPYFAEEDGVLFAMNEYGNYEKFIDVTPRPFGEVGDTLWVKETFQLGLCTESSIAYRATHKPEDLEEGQGEVIKWKPSIHMPEWASRIKLKITSIRIEKIQDITEVGSKAEGAKPSFRDEFDIVHTQPSYRDGFILNIWNPIYNDKNKPEFAWDKNPWVWVIDFEVSEACQ